jgi:hypothetical protein
LFLFSGFATSEFSANGVSLCEDYGIVTDTADFFKQIYRKKIEENAIKK